MPSHTVEADKSKWLMFNQRSLTQGELESYQKVRCLPELGLESLSRGTVPLGSGVGGESKSEGTSQDRVDQRELFPLLDEDWLVPSPELVPQSSGLLWMGSATISDGDGA